MVSPSTTRRTSTGSVNWEGGTKEGGVVEAVGGAGAVFSPHPHRKLRRSVDVPTHIRAMKVMRDAVIVQAVRTPIGRIRGALSALRPDDLLALTFEALIERAGIESSVVDEVFAGCANQAGEDNRNVARMASLLAGFPQEIPAITVNRLCASGLDAVIAAVRAIWVGDREVVVAGGVESMTRAPYAMAKNPVGYGTGNPQIFDTTLGWRFPNPKMEALFPLEGMGETAENIAERYGISRERQDQFAYESHQKALSALDSGRFVDEIVPVSIKGRKATTIFERDEGPRQDTTLEKLATLRPVFRSGGTVSAGNSSSLNDGASALLIMTSERAKELGLTPMARILGGNSAGVDPRVMGLGPVPATKELLSRVGKSVSDIQLAELNEAFAVQSLAVLDLLGLDPGIVNVNGGAIALGHPLGCSGARILTTLVHEMGRRDIHLGLATLCVGVGQGVSVLVDR